MISLKWGAFIILKASRDKSYSAVENVTAALKLLEPLVIHGFYGPWNGAARGTRRERDEKNKEITSLLLQIAALPGNLIVVYHT